MCNKKVFFQGSHRLEKYLNLEGFVEKFLKIKKAMKSNEKLHKASLKSPKILLFYVGINTDNSDINQIKL